MFCFWGGGLLMLCRLTKQAPATTHHRCSNTAQRLLPPLQAAEASGEVQPGDKVVRVNDTSTKGRWWPMAREQF